MREAAAAAAAEAAAAPAAAVAAVAAAPAAAHISGGTKLPRAHATLIVEESGHPSLAISKKLI